MRQLPSWLICDVEAVENQAYGKRAKQAASDLAFGQEVTVQT
jgi:hypothetical protein